MHPVRKQRLMIVLFVVVFSSAAIGLMVYGLRGNINLFYPPADIAVHGLDLPFTTKRGADRDLGAGLLSSPQGTSVATSRLEFDASVVSPLRAIVFRTDLGCVNAFRLARIDHYVRPC